jgi:hypothetical protein
MATATKYAKILLGCYRTGEANDPEVYASAVTHILAQYPEDIMRSVSDPLTGLPSKIEWLPKLKEVLAACEEIAGFRRRMSEWDQRTAQQLAEREKLEQAGPRKVPQHMLDELAAAGLTKQPRLRDLETPGKVMAKYGISQAQWDAIPNANPK